MSVASSSPARALWLVAVLASSASLAQTFRMTVLDVGQGDATVVVAPSGCAALLDAGPSGSGTAIKAYLKSLGISRLDFAVLSHYHADHMAGMDEVELGTDPVQIARVYDHGGSYGTVGYDVYADHFSGRRVTARRGDVIDLCGEVRFEVLASGGNGLSISNENAASVVVKVSYGAFDALVGGDATSESPNLESTFAADVGPVEAYKVHHHGSRTSSGEELLDVMMPTVAFISVGKDNNYGHPAPEVLSRLAARDVAVWQTEDPERNTVRGHIEVASSDGSHYTVTQGPGSQGFDSKGATQTPDLQAPTTPSGLVASAASATEVELSWNAASDDRGVTSYRIFRSDDGNSYVLAGTTSGTALFDTGLTADSTYWYQVSALDAAGNESAPSAPVSVTTPPLAPSTCASTEQLFLNPGFESGSAGWTTTSGVIARAKGSRSGRYRAYLNGEGSASVDALSQVVTIPADACSAAVSFWLRVESDDNSVATVHDTLELTVRDTSGNVLASVGTWSNLNASRGYIQRTVDLSAFRGRTVRIHWQGTEDASEQTGFFIDDTALTVVR